MADIHIRTEGHAGRITLTRPKALNALSHDMALQVDAALVAWRDDPAVALVLFDAEGPRAFCSGGDIVAVYDAGRRGDFAAGQRYWADEYRMNARIAQFPKPVVALVQGFCMGGGVGLAGHARHRVVGESLQVAMPECAIGLIPDVGGSLLLGRAPGHIGEYLGLTGTRMGPADAIFAGFADHFVPESAWPALIAALVAGGDPAAIMEAARPAPGGTLAALQPAIDASFEADDLAAISARLEADDWGHGILRLLARQSPLSMACTLALVRAARRDGGIGKALAREYRFTYRAQGESDFLEGVRAALIDKDRKPLWRDGLDEVGPDRVRAMLAPLGDAELRFPA